MITASNVAVPAVYVQLKWGNFTLTNLILVTSGDAISERGWPD